MKSVADVARESAYVAVGVGVLGIQQALTRRHEIESRLRAIDPEINARITWLHEEVGRRLHEVERMVIRAEEQLSPSVQGTVRAIRTQLIPN